MTDQDAHRSFVEGRWPELAVGSFEPLGDGWNCFTFLASAEWVFQFPRLPDADERLRKQTAVLPEIAREVSSAVPVPSYTSTDPDCMGYRRIVRRPMCASASGEPAGSTFRAAAGTMDARTR